MYPGKYYTLYCEKIVINLYTGQSKVIIIQVIIYMPIYPEFCS